jgi:hypothetical protein
MLSLIALIRRSAVGARNNPALAVLEVRRAFYRPAARARPFCPVRASTLARGFFI